MKPYSNRNGNKDGLTQGDTITQASSLAFLRSGSYGYNDGNLNYRISAGYYWYNYLISNTTTYQLAFTSAYIYTYTGTNYGFGISLRCLAR